MPGALPTMVCRPPTLNGSPRSLDNEAAVLAMPGVTHVALVETGVAVRAETFGQCIDAIRAMSVTWNPGSVEGESDATILARLRKAELPLAVPDVPLLAQTVEQSFTFMFRSSAALEPNCAVADVRADEATVWAGLKVPILAQQDIARRWACRRTGSRSTSSPAAAPSGTSSSATPPSRPRRSPRRWAPRSG